MSKPAPDDYFLETSAYEASPGPGIPAPLLITAGFPLPIRQGNGKTLDAQYDGPHAGPTANSDSSRGDLRCRWPPPTPDAPKPAPRVTDLLPRASDGDPRAWEEIVRRYSGVVRATVWSYQLQDNGALDATQMTWLRLTENIHQVLAPERLSMWALG